MGTSEYGAMDGEALSRMIRPLAWFNSAGGVVCDAFLLLAFDFFSCGLNDDTPFRFNIGSTWVPFFGWEKNGLWERGAWK